MIGMTKRAWGRTSGAALILISGLVAAGAQQPMVARAARPALRPAMQTEPGQPEPPQANSGPMRDDLFAGTEKFAKNATDVSEISMDPQTLGMVRGPDSKKAHNTLLSTVRSYTYEKPGMYNMADVDEYRRRIETGDWHCSVHTRDTRSGEATDICSRHPTPDTIENAIITVEPKELTFIHTIKRINGEGGGLDIGGMPEAFMGLPPDVSMAILGPEMRAEMIASTAALRAEMPAMMKSLGQLKIQMPNLNSEEMQESFRQAQKLRQQFRLYKLPPAGQSPDTFQLQPATPDTPEAPATPPAPKVPATPPSSH